MTQNSAALAGKIDKFQIFKAKEGSNISVDMLGACVELKYYESVLSNTISASAIIVETGFTDRTDEDGELIRGIVDTLPVRGGEPVFLEFEDAQPEPNKLSFKTNDTALYVNRLRGLDPGTQKDVYVIDLCTREFLTNEQTRVKKRYDEKISDNVRTILTEQGGIQIKKNINIDETAIPYNFIGNQKKPFYLCTWLASKSVPVISIEGESNVDGRGGAAGYFFFENYEGFQFRSLDKLLDKKRDPVKKYIYTGNESYPPEYNGHITSVSMDRDIDLQQNLALGTYANRSIFFNYASMYYEGRDYNIVKNQKDKIVNAGEHDIAWVAPAFREGPSRLMNHILDVGTLPSGNTAKEQLENRKENPTKPTWDAADTMVQSIMRYNQLFTIKINIMIPGDFSLKAGDLIHCEFPLLTTDTNKEVNPESGGIYMIASLCHRITPENTYTSLSLVRDTKGRKSPSN